MISFIIALKKSSLESFNSSLDDCLLYIFFISNTNSNIFDLFRLAKNKKLK